MSHICMFYLTVNYLTVYTLKTVYICHSQHCDYHLSKVATGLLVTTVHAVRNDSDWFSPHYPTCVYHADVYNYGTIIEHANIAPGFRYHIRLQ